MFLFDDASRYDSNDDGDFFVVVLTRDYFNLIFYARESGQVHGLLDESEFNHRL